MPFSLAHILSKARGTVEQDMFAEEDIDTHTIDDLSPAVDNKLFLGLHTQKTHIDIGETICTSDSVQFSKTPIEDLDTANPNMLANLVESVGTSDSMQCSKMSNEDAANPDSMVDIGESVSALDSMKCSKTFNEDVEKSDLTVDIMESSSSVPCYDESAEVIGSASANTQDVNVQSDNTAEMLSEEQIPPLEDIYDFSHIPLQITGSWAEFSNNKKNNYTRGCKWAPDGSCILTCSDDNILRIFNLPQELWDFSKWEDIAELEAVLKIPEGELIYDFCWYPLMNSADPSTCCLASSSKTSPVHLWDAFTGELRCSYRIYDQMDEVTAARSIGFDADGQRLFCGFENAIRIFNVDLPGRKFEERKTFEKKSGQQGIISCFAFTAANRSISAAGSYRKTIGIYSEPQGELECILEGQKGGVTQLQFSPDGNLLYSGGRMDPEILCWDMRNLGSVLYCLRRSCVTNQRMYFDITRCGRYIASGNHNGVVSVWDSHKEPKETSLDDYCILEPVQFYLGHHDCVNGISIHPSFPLLCSSSGQRKFADLLPDEEEGMFSTEVPKCDNSLRLWWTGTAS